MGFKFLEHTADIKILAEEKNLDFAFITSALALKQVMAEDIEVKSKINKILKIEGKDLSDLLYNFLEEFLYLLDAENFILSKVEDLEVNLDKESKKYVLTSTISGDKASNYKFSNSVKAITFNDMKIQEDKKTKKTTIQFVLDV